MAPPEKCGPYELVRWVEAGGMGEIFLARGPRPGGGTGLAAVKRLLPQAATDPTFVQMFLDEGRLVKQLNHPGVCRVWDLGQSEGQYFMAMEWIEGVSLQLLLRRAAGRGGLPIQVAAHIASEVAGALDYAHRAKDDSGEHLGIVHRDVSPPNIMIGMNGRVKLLDFGLAKARTHLAKTQPGFVKGKFGYLAPEQLTGKVDYRTDVFALGLCLYEALTGSQLFDQSTAAATIAAIRVYDQAPSARALRPEVPEPLDAVVKKALASRPSERFQSAGEMKLYIDRALQKSDLVADKADVASVAHSLFPDRIEGSEEAPPPPSSPPDAQQMVMAAVDARYSVPPPGQRVRMVAIALAAFVLLLAAAAFWLLGH